MKVVPKKFFLTSGVGRDKDYIMSFAIALEDAGIGKFNLVKVSSIIPPGCDLISKDEGLKLLSPGQIIHCVLAENTTQKADELITAALGAAIPASKTEVGYFFEFTDSGKTKEETGIYAEGLARSMVYKTSGLSITQSLNIACEAKGVNSLWTTVVAVAVYIFT
ncbi:MAG: arginine decarboxylase, pyruvoyl-dependent [bacterium]|nr:arginine decarboxylase, pyruvoyl-dependent [bacterium]